MADEEKKRTERTAQFRFVFANSFGMKFSDNDVAILFGNEQEFNNDKTTYEEVSVVMTPRSAKILAHMLNGAMKNFEAVAGPIPVPEGKLEGIDARLSEQLEQRQGKKS